MIKPRRKPTLEQYMRKQVENIRKAFKVPMRVTVVCRVPGQPDGELVFSDDDMDSLIETLQRRRDAVVASQAAGSGAA